MRIHGSGNLAFRSCFFSGNTQPAVHFLSFTGRFTRIHMDDTDFQNSLNGAPTPEACSSSPTLCADSGLPGTLR